MLININDAVKITNYKKFSRVTKNGYTENFYLALRPKSTSRLTLDGLSPSNFEKIFVVTQNIRYNPYYNRLKNMFGVRNSFTDMKFYDSIPKDITNYAVWRANLEECIEVFNESFKSYSINAKITEVTDKTLTKNTISYGIVPDDYAGLCTYNKTSNSFAIYVNSDTYMVYLNHIKSTLIHEMGHLLGFNDSTYATDDSLFSYSRDRDAVVSTTK